MKILICVIWIILFPFLASAQISSVNANSGCSYFGIGFEYGITSFYGDVDEGPAPGNLFRNNQAYKIQINRNFNSTFEAGIRVMTGGISGEKIRGENGTTTHIYFQNRFIEYTFETGVNLMAFFTDRFNCKFELYGTAGLGFTDFRTRLYDFKNDTVLNAYGYDGQKATTEFVLPIGLKAIYHLSPSSAFMLQVTSSRVDTDKLDGLTGNSNRDYYNFYSIGYRYKIPLDIKQKRILLGIKNENRLE